LFTGNVFRWADIREEGHKDAKKDGWIELTGKESLVTIISTMAWVASAHHAAVNFGQYDYSAWMPNHASITRKPAPARGSAEWQVGHKGDGRHRKKQRDGIQEKRIYVRIVLVVVECRVMGRVILCSQNFTLLLEAGGYRGELCKEIMLVNVKCGVLGRAPWCEKDYTLLLGAGGYGV
jgi:hypothetical protein